MKHDPTLFDIWTPTSTCEIGSLIGPAIGVAGSLIGASQSAGAAEDAAGAQVEAARLATELGRETLGFQKEAFNATRGDQWDAFSFNRADTAPYRATGAGALQTMNNMFLPGGNSMVQMQGRLNELRAEREKLLNAPAPIDAPAPAPVQQAAAAPAPTSFGGPFTSENQPPWDPSSRAWQEWQRDQK